MRITIHRAPISPLRLVPSGFGMSEPSRLQTIRFCGHLGLQSPVKKGNRRVDAIEISLFIFVLEMLFSFVTKEVHSSRIAADMAHYLPLDKAGIISTVLEGILYGLYLEVYCIHFMPLSNSI